MATPVKFRDRPRANSIEGNDVFPLSRMAGGTATTYSIYWSDMSAQIVAEVAEARQEMVDGFSETIEWVNLALAGNAPTVHTHVIADITGLSGALAAKATPFDISTAINNLVNGAPGLLDTLAELGAALGNDPNFAATITTALSGKEATLTAGTSAQYYRGDKTWQTLNKAAVGLGNVDNTSDIAKPISTLTQAALNAKLGNPGAPVARSISFGTAYQATDPTKPAAIYATVETTYTITIAGTQQDTVEIRVGTDATTVANGTSGTAVDSFRSSLTGVALTIGMGQVQRGPLVAIIPVGGYFALRRVVGSNASIISCVEQPFG